jgi:hypothetical protein
MAIPTAIAKPTNGKTVIIHTSAANDVAIPRRVAFKERLIGPA